MSIQLYRERLPGLLVVILLTGTSYSIMTLPSLTRIGLNPLVIAIILGMITGNIIRLPTSLTSGIQFAAKQLLRTAIVLYGFRVSFQEITSVGLPALLLDVAVVTCTLYFGYQIGRRFLKLDSELALLISAGAAICGAAAVLAVEDVIKSEPYKATIAVGTVVLFGTISMFLYPALQHAGFFGFTDAQYGIFAGASIHEVAQALVAGTSISPEIGETAVIVKMIRVLLLVPVLLILSAWNAAKNQHGSRKKKVMVPWFAVGFLIVIVFHSLQILPLPVVNLINKFDIILLSMAMGAIGLETKFSKIKKVGMKPLYLAILIFFWLLFFAGSLVKLI